MAIGVSIVIPCLTSTKVMPFESRPRCLSPRIWCTGFQGVYRIQTVWSRLSVNSILRYLNFWNYQSEPDYNWPVIFRTILSTSNMLHLLLTFSFKFNLQALTNTILAGSSSSRWIYATRQTKLSVVSAVVFLLNAHSLWQARNDEWRQEKID